MRQFRSFEISSLVVFAFGSCASPTDVPNRVADADGFVMSVAARSVHIKAMTEQCGIVFNVDDGTRILARRADGTVVRAGRSDVTVGRRALGWADGAIAESCPAQARQRLWWLREGPAFTFYLF